MNLRIIGKHFIAQILNPDIPRVDGAVDQRRISALAERIAMLNRGLMNQLPFVLEPLDNSFVGIFTEHPSPIRNLRGELAIFIERFDQRNSGSAANTVIVFAIRRSHMNNTGSVFGADKVIQQNAERARIVFEIVKERFVGQSNKFGATVTLENFEILFGFVVGHHANRGHDEHFERFIISDGHIIDFRPQTDREIGWKRPWCCCPN